jgi:hypothetical protein
MDSTGSTIGVGAVPYSRQSSNGDERVTFAILASQFNANPAEIRQFLQGALDADRVRELTDQMLAAGLPL